jgi:hypothetical protein
MRHGKRDQLGTSVSRADVVIDSTGRSLQPRTRVAAGLGKHELPLS